MTRILFLIRSLDRGGAQRQLVELARGMAALGFSVIVCTFYDGGALRRDLDETAGVSLISLHKGGRWDLVRFMWRFQRVVADVKPDIIHGYMGIANELALLAARCHGSTCIWGLRASDMDFSLYDILSRRAFEVGATMSRFADAIIVNSRAGYNHYVRHGYEKSRMHVIHNSVDCERFAPDPAAGVRFRREFRIAFDEILVGLVARLDPMKDHTNFLRAAAQASAQNAQLRFVCVGEGDVNYTRKLHELADSCGLRHKLVWAGARDDMPAVYSALDLCVLSSAFGEGFPNVVAEAMACERPCVVTEVGDAAYAVGTTGRAVPPRNPSALSQAILEMAALPSVTRAELGTLARRRVIENFSRSALLKATIRVLEAASPNMKQQSSILDGVGHSPARKATTDTALRPK